MLRLDHSPIATCSVRDRSHFFQSELSDFQRVQGPEIFSEEFKRKISVVADSRELIAVEFKIDGAVAGEDSVGILLSVRRRICWSIIEVRDRNLVAFELRKRSDGPAASPAMERVYHNRGIWMTGPLDDVDGVIDGVDIVDKSEILKRWFDTERFANLKQFGIVLGSKVPVCFPRRRSCDRTSSRGRGNIFDRRTSARESRPRSWSEALFRTA